MLNTKRPTSLILRKDLKDPTDPYTSINTNKADTDNQRIFLSDSKSSKIQQIQSYCTTTPSNYNQPNHVTLKVAVTKQVIDVIINAKCNLTRTVKFKDHNIKVFSKYAFNLKMSDNISNPNSPYINENQCNNIAHFEPPRNKIQPNICNQRKIINNPLEKKP